MSTFGEDLIQALNEALAHAKGEGPAIVHAAVDPRAIRTRAKLTQAQMAPLMGMSLSGYRKVGAGPEARQRPRCSPATGDREGTGGSAAGAGGLMPVEGKERLSGSDSLGSGGSAFLRVCFWYFQNEWES